MDAGAEKKVVNFAREHLGIIRAVIRFKRNRKIYEDLAFARSEAEISDTTLSESLCEIVSNFNSLEEPFASAQDFLEVTAGAELGVYFTPKAFEDLVKIVQGGLEETFDSLEKRCSETERAALLAYKTPLIAEIFAALDNPKTMVLRPVPALVSKQQPKGPLH